MNISSINNCQMPTQYSNPRFKAKKIVTEFATKPATANLSWNTVKDLKTIMRAYKSIKSKLDSLSEAGISFIEKNYPNISIGESLIFHNCGDKKSSILVRCAESFEYAGLSRIIERKGNSTWSDRIVLNSFLIDNEDKLLNNPDENKQKLFPKTREYLTKEDVEKDKLEESLQRVMMDLDVSMLSFRKFLATIDSQYNKTPDGLLTHNTIAMLRDIQNFQKDIDSKLNSLPKKVELSIRKSFPNYKLITGLTTHAFGNLGKDKISLTYNPIIAPEMENYRRLNVFDENDNLIKTFVVSTNGKMISNLNQNSTIHLPRKLSFVDAKNIDNEEYGPSFVKYLSIYHSKLKELSEYVNRNYLERLKFMNSVPLVVENEIQTEFQTVLNDMQEINNVLNNLPSAKAFSLKKTVPDLYLSAGSRGITFENFKDGKKVYLLPMNSRRHDNLIKLSITDSDDNEKFYVIKNLKHIVKNMNPQYPQMLPKILIFLTEANGDIDPEIKEALDFLQEKMTIYKGMAQKEFENFNTKKNKTIQEKQQKLEERLQQIEERKEAKKIKEESKIKKEQMRLEAHLRLLEERKKIRELEAAERKAEKQSQKEERSLKIEKQPELPQKAQERAELNRRKDFILDCRKKLVEMKENVNSKTEDFKAVLEGLKSMTEEFIKSLG